MDIILLSGLWLDGSAWDKVTPELAVLGHTGCAPTLPGQGAGSETAGLTDQLRAVLAVIDATDGPVAVAGHSAASSLAWMAIDARPTKVTCAIFIGGFPRRDGQTYADLAGPREDPMPFPGWHRYDHSDLLDLDEGHRRRFEARSVTMSAHVANGVIRLRDPRRHSIPVSIICTGFTAQEARSWIAAGEATEVQRADRVTWVDLHTGHWPMLTAPRALATAIAHAAAETGPAR